MTICIMDSMHSNKNYLATPPTTLSSDSSCSKTYKSKNLKAILEYSMEVGLSRIRVHKETQGKLCFSML